MESKQFILEFPLTPDCSFDSFVAWGENRRVVEAIRHLKTGSEHGLILTGEAGCGKTHLLKGAVNHFNTPEPSPSQQAVYLDLPLLKTQLNPKDEQAFSTLLGRYGNLALVAVDHLEQLEGEPALQEALLFLFNRVRASQGKLLCASRLAPQAISWLREDLSSRLLWGELLTLSSPNDAELKEILNKMARDRQVNLSQALIHFLHLRLPRSMSAYAQAMDQLDRAGMQLKQRMTVPFAKKVLNL
ncbi:MAG: hypothetical protein HQL72_03245 [Magnetococcales bacterium]|nr:hypothetical protein [Magnetococcales bacterium]